MKQSADQRFATANGASWAAATEITQPEAARLRERDAIESLRPFVYAILCPAAAGLRRDKRLRRNESADQKSKIKFRISVAAIGGPEWRSELGHGTSPSDGGPEWRY